MVSLPCTTLKGQMNFGFKLGPSLGWVGSTTTAGSPNGARVGLNFGVFTDQYFNDNLALSIGVNYDFVRMSYNFTDRRLVPNFLEESNVMVNREFKGSYIEVPLKMKGKFEVVESLNLYGEAGVGIAVNLGAKGKDNYSYYGINYEDATYQDYSYEYNLFQGSLHFGIGADYEISSGLSVFAQLSYRHALWNTFNQTLYKATNSSLRHNFIGLEFGILLL